MDNKEIEELTDALEKFDKERTEYKFRVLGDDVVSWPLHMPRTFCPNDIKDISIGLRYNRMPDCLDPIVDCLDSTYDKDSGVFTFMYYTTGGWGRKDITKMSIKLSLDMKYTISVVDKSILISSVSKH